MSPQDEIQRAADAIRARADELAAHGELPDSSEVNEVLASLIEGTASLDDIDEETLDRCLREVGTDHFVQVLVAGKEAMRAAQSREQVHSANEEFTAAEVIHMPVRQKSEPPGSSWWRQHGGWLAAAASMAFVTTVAIYQLSTPPTQQDTPQLPVGIPPSELRVAFHWPEHLSVDPSALTPWGLPSPALPLPKGLPDFEKGGGGGTLGAPGADRFDRWRLATVIVKTEQGVGSGAFISADGWLLTNYHVVDIPSQHAALAGTVPAVEVILGQEVKGRIKPRPAVKARVYRVDPVHDLALLKLETVPDGMKTVPFFKLATRVTRGEECYAVGSEVNRAAWSIRSGNVERIAHYPDELGQVVTGVARTETTVSRMQATIIVTDTTISAGDSGGPLLNQRGELIGLTVTSRNNQGAGGWHITVEHLRAMMTTFPTQPEGVPFDVWTAGLPHARMGTPRQADGNRDGQIDTLVVPYSESANTGLGQADQQVVAFTLFIDLAQRAAASRDAADLMPVGIWGQPDRGRFRYDLSMTIRADGVLAVGYPNPEGIVDEIRLGSGKEDKVALIWHRDQAGTWQAMQPSAQTPFLDPARVSEANRRQIGLIYQSLILKGEEGTSTPPTPSGSSHHGDPKGPN